MKLSERLAEVIRKFGMDYDDHETVSEAIQLAKSVESAPAGELIEVMDRSSTVNWDKEAPSHLYGRRVALVPLPQQSET